MSSCLCRSMPMLLLLLLVVVLLLGGVGSAWARPPIVLLPESGESMIQIKFTGKPPAGCPELRDVWIDFFPNLFATDFPDCFISAGYITYNGTHYETPPNTTFRGTRHLKDVFNFYQVLLKANWTYEVDLFGAEYDYRLAPDGLQDYYAELRKKIEHVATTTRQRVTLYAVGNSVMVAMGFYEYINATVGDSWARQYICHFVADSGQYGGALEAVTIATNGIFATYAPTPEQQLAFRDVVATWPNVYWNFPKVGPGPETYPDDFMVLSLNGRRYSAPQLGQFLTDIFNRTEPEMLWRRVLNITSVPFPVPPVNTTMIGVVDYYSKYFFEYWSPPAPGQLPPYPPEYTADDGDGLISGRSVMRGYREWVNAMPARGLTLTVYPLTTNFSVGHNQCLNPNFQPCSARVTADLGALQCGL